MKNDCLLISTAINPPVGVLNLALQSPVIRLLATKMAIYQWATWEVSSIVVIDSTETQPLNHYDISAMAERGIVVEQLAYQQNNSLVQSRGKGYAEAVLLDYAIKNSDLLRSQPSFYKCTGKLFVNNFPQIDAIVHSNSLSSLFWRWSDGTPSNLFGPYVDARFYYCNLRLLSEFILPSALNSDDSTGNILERVYYDSISKIMKNGETIKPEIIGLNGGGGKMYPIEGLGSVDRRFPCFYTTE